MHNYEWHYEFGMNRSHNRDKTKKEKNRKRRGGAKRDNREHNKITKNGGESIEIQIRPNNNLKEESHIQASSKLLGYPFVRVLSFAVAGGLEQWDQL